MTANKSMLISSAISIILCYSVVDKNEITNVILNAYTAMSVILFFIFMIMSIAVNIEKNNDDINKFLLDYKKKKSETNNIVKKIDVICDSVLLFFLFGYGHYVLGTIWLFINFIFTNIIKEAAKKHKENKWKI